MQMSIYNSPSKGQLINQLIDQQKDQNNIEGIYLQNIYDDSDMSQQKTISMQANYASQLESNRNLEKFYKFQYSTFQNKDDYVEIRKKNQFPYVQNELKTHMLYQQVDNDEFKGQTVSQDLPQCFLSVIEHLRLIVTRTKGQAINVKKIQDLKISLARLELTAQVEKPYIFSISNIDQTSLTKFKRSEEIKKELAIYERITLSNLKQVDKIILNQTIYSFLEKDEIEYLVREKILKNLEEIRQKEKEQINCKDLDILTIMEINRCFYNDQYLSKIYIFSTCINRILQGDFNFIELLYIEDKNTPLTIHPCILSTKLYFEDRLAEERGGEVKKKIYSKISSLPQIIFINLDGFDNPLNLEVIKKFTTFSYFTIFHEFFNPDGPFSFYKYLQKNSETLKQFFPYFLPFYKHMEEYYKEKGKIKQYSLITNNSIHFNFIHLFNLYQFYRNLLKTHIQKSIITHPYYIFLLILFSHLILMKIIFQCSFINKDKYYISINKYKIYQINQV